MKIHELQLESTKDQKRVGRGIGSGYGKTSGRGTKGQNARTGGGVRPGFEGGQNPLAKRLPKKRGFVALNHTEYQVVGLGGLEQFKAGTTVDADTLKSAGLVKKQSGRLKLHSGGDFTKKLTVKVNAASASAIKAVEAAGGNVEITKFVAPASKKATRPAKAEGKPAAKAAAPKAAATPKAEKAEEQANS
jgi:large subunit ribosomal protein L15